MSTFNKPKFEFVANGDSKLFRVVNFKGKEGLSVLYEFDITLVSENGNIDFDDVLYNSCTFTIKRDQGDIVFHGIAAGFDQLQAAHNVYFYRVQLVPKHWRLTLAQQNQIFLNENVQEFMTGVLVSGGLSDGLDFEFRLAGNYEPREYVCQYNETYFNFFSRWLERYGMYYFFDQSGDTEKMVITDTVISHTAMPQGEDLRYVPGSGLDAVHGDEVIKNITFHQQPLPNKVLLKDYNYRKPELDMAGKAVVSDKGVGEFYIYGEHFQTVEEGNRLAKIRAEEFLCHEKTYSGLSAVPFVRPGYTFSLKNHFRNDFNQRFLTMGVQHQGGQEMYLANTMNLHFSKDVERITYSNTFTCIPAETQFRPKRTAQVPRFSGTMNAKVDAAGSGKYAELDEQGRYRVILPFDVSGRENGKATASLRMAQPYAGSDHGMHFPLHKGTEVLVTFIDGHPDRPIIQSAVPNPVTPSVVDAQSQTQCRITSGGQNRIHLEDQDGNQRILMHSPTHNTFLRMGSHNDPPSTVDGGMYPGSPDPQAEWEALKAAGGFVLNTEKNCMQTIGGWLGYQVTEGEKKLIEGCKWDWINGWDSKTVTGLKTDTLIGGSVKTELAVSLNVNSAVKNIVKAIKNKVHGSKNEATGEEAKTSAESTKLEALKTQLQEEVSKLQGQQDQLVGALQMLAGETSKLAGAVDEMNGSVDVVVGSRTHVEAEQAMVMASANSMNGSVNAMAMEQSMLVTTETVVAVSQSEVSADTNKIAAEMSNISGIINML